MSRTIVRVLPIIALCALAACCPQKSRVCPEFPVPDPVVAERLDALSAMDRDLRAWGNDLLKLKEKLDACNKVGGND